MKKAKQVLSILLAVLMIVLLVPVAFGTEIVASGKCGENLTWALDNQGTLTIDGTGEMWDYNLAAASYGRAYGDYYYGSVTKIIIGDRVTSIGNNAFNVFGLYSQGGEVEPVKEVIIGKSVKEIGEEAFFNLSSLETIEIPQSVQTIAPFAFAGCTNLSEIDLHSGLKTIGEGAFAYAPIKELFIPETVSFLGASFTDSRLLERIVVDENNPYYCSDEYGCLYNKDKTVLLKYPGGNQSNEFVVPSTVNEIGEQAFMGAMISFLNLPQGLTRIDGYALYGSYIKELIVPKTVVFIGGGAIGACKQLKSIYVHNKECVIEEEIIGNMEDWHEITIESSASIYGYSKSTAEAYAQKYNRTFVALDMHTHTPTTYTQPSTCTIPGYTITTCSKCNEQLDYQVLPLAPHQYGAWVTIKEPTTTEKGLRERTCTVCGVAKEQEDIPMLTVVTVEDKNTGIQVSFGEDSYEGNVELVIESNFTGSQYLTQSYSMFEPFNIKTYIDGKEVQPNKPVTVRIPMPAGYDPNNIAVFHVNSKTGQAEKISDVRVENGYIVFTAASFSVYIVVDESSVVQPEPEKDPNTCPWCGKVHKGFFQNIIAFFHRIFAKLFGAKY